MVPALSRGGRGGDAEVIYYLIILHGMAYVCTYGRTYTYVPKRQYVAHVRISTHTYQDMYKHSTCSKTLNNCM